MGNIKAFFKKFLYAFGANTLTMVVSIATTLLIPKFLGDSIEQYGYFQVYLFYVGYIGFFHLGWCDGIFLRDGGKKYEDLNKPLYSSQFWLLSFFETVISVFIIIIGYIFTKDTDYIFIIWMIAANIFVYLPTTMLNYYLQTTNRIKEFATITGFGRLIYCLSIIAVLFSGIRDYKLFIWGDLLGKIIAVTIACLWCRDIIFTKPAPIRKGLKEAQDNISVGINLLFANIASLLITGIVRWGIQQKWDVATYGKISFTLSVSNLLLIFISAIALVLYPTLRRTENSKLPSIYSTLRNVLMIPLLGLLILYYPVQLMLSAWIPQYAESIKYMAILFPLCIYAAKMTMLIQTYMQVFRLEKLILRINIFGVLVAIITTLISVFVFNNLTLAMLSIVINQMFRCVYAEMELSKKINIFVLKDIILEITMTIVFISFSWFLGGWISVFIYFTVYLIYLIIKKSDMVNLVQYLKLFIKNRNKNKGAI